MKVLVVFLLLSISISAQSSFNVFKVEESQNDLSGWKFSYLVPMELSESLDFSLGASVYYQFHKKEQDYSDYSKYQSELFLSSFDFEINSLVELSKYKIKPYLGLGIGYEYFSQNYRYEAYVSGHKVDIDLNGGGNRYYLRSLFGVSYSIFKLVKLNIEYGWKNYLEDLTPIHINLNKHIKENNSYVAFGVGITI